MVGDHLHPAFEAAVYGALLARRADALRAKVRTACLAGDRRLVPPVPGLHPHAAHLLCRAELRLEVDQCPAVGQQIGRAHVELQSLMRISYAVFCLKKKKSTINVKSLSITHA